MNRQKPAVFGLLLGFALLAGNAFFGVGPELRAGSEDKWISDLHLVQASLAPQIRKIKFFIASLSSPSRQAADCIRDRNCYKPFVVSHRGSGFGKPENSRGALLECIRTGVPVLETDLRSSRDGRIFILHDETLDRTTSMKGKAQNLSWKELSKARLSNGESLPLFEEMYSLAQGKVLLILDFKENQFYQAAEWIAKNGSFDDVIFSVEREADMREAARAKARFPRMMVMTRVYSPRDLLEMEKILGGLPEIVEVSPVEGSSFPRWLRAKGVKSSAEVRSYFLKEALRQKLDFLESDRPVQLLRMIPPASKKP